MPVDSISSTEKLLDVIRQKGEPSVHKTSRTFSPYSKGQNYKKGSIPFRKTLVIGVDIGLFELKLIKLKCSNSQLQVIDYENIAIPTQIKDQSIAFVDFLRTSLLYFCGKLKNYQIWTTISDDYIELKHITIPVVPKKHIPKSVRWMAKKEIGFDENKHIIDFELQDDTEADGVIKKSVIVYIADKLRVEGLKNLFFRCGFKLSGITISPFAIQNLFRTRFLDLGAQQLKFDEDAATFYIGSDYSRINIFSKQNLVLTRNIKAGTNSMIESLRAELIANEKNKSFTEQEIRKIFFNLLPGYFSRDESVTTGDLSDQDIFSMTYGAVERLIRQADRTFEHYFIVSSGQRKVKKIFILGEIAASDLFTDYIKKHMAGELEVIDPFSHMNFFNSDMDPPGSLVKRVAYTRAVGLALSSNVITPNLLKPYEKKEKEQIVELVNKSICGVFAIVFIILLSVFFWQTFDRSSKEKKLINMKSALKEITPFIDQTLILEMAAKVKQSIKRKEEFIKKYLLLAIGNDILINAAGRRIKFIRCLIVLDKKNNKGSVNKAGEGGKPNTGRNKIIEVEGFVAGDKGFLEANLVGYIVRLHSSPLFSRIKVNSLKREKSRKYGEVLSFSILMNIEVV